MKKHMKFLFVALIFVPVFSFASVCDGTTVVIENATGDVFDVDDLNLNTYFGFDSKLSPLKEGDVLSAHSMSTNTANSDGGTQGKVSAEIELISRSADGKMKLDYMGRPDFPGQGAASVSGVSSDNEYCSVDLKLENDTDDYTVTMIEESGTPGLAKFIIKKK